MNAIEILAALLLVAGSALVLSALIASDHRAKTEELATFEETRKAA